MGVPPSALPAGPNQAGPNQARNEHIEKYALPDDAEKKRAAEERARDPNSPAAVERSAYKQLLDAIAHTGPAFQQWQLAREEYNRVVHDTAVSGKETDAENANRRGEAMDQLRLARIEYLAPLDVATAKARAGKQPPLLTREEWELLACAKDTSIKDMVGEERAAAVEQFKKDNYGQYEGMITDDQLTRAGTTVRGFSFTRLKDNAAYVASSLWNLNFRNLKYAGATEGERMLVARATTSEARRDLELSAKAEAQKQLQQLMNDGSVEGNALKQDTPEAKAKKLEELTKAEIAKINDEAIEKRIVVIDTNREAVRQRVEIGRQSYETDITDMTANMQIGLQAVNKLQEDITGYNQDGNGPINEDHKDLVEETVEKATRELEKAVVLDFHHHSRLEQEKSVGAGLASRYSNKKNIWGNEVTPIIATQSDVSEEFASTLGKLDENVNKFQKDPNGNPTKTLKKGEVLTINGVPCGRVGHIDMYNIESEFSFMGFRFDDRPQRIGKMFEAWMCETTSANQGNYQGGTLSRDMMMKAYASGPTLPDGTKNANIGPNGQPINAFRISAFPVRGGVGATCRAFAEMQAIAHILGIAINIDIGAIEQNSDNKSKALEIKLEWLAHNRIDDPRYGAPALALVQKRYGIDPTWPPEKQKAELMLALTGSDVASREIGMEFSNANEEDAAGTKVSSDKTPAPKSTTPPTPTSGTGTGEQRVTVPAAPTPPPASTSTVKVTQLKN
jgi:hypothetical protein